MSSDIVPRSSVVALVAAYQHAGSQIKMAYKLLEDAKETLDQTFISGSGYYFSVNDCDRPGVGDKAYTKQMDALKRDAWRAIVDRLELRKMLSIKRREELDKQLYCRDHYRDDKVLPLPEITEENVFAMLEETAAKSVDYAKEAVFEVFDWLRPRGGRNADLKTNQKWKVGNKIITRGCELRYSRGAFTVMYDYQKHFIALDNVFHMLDGRGVLKSHSGPLVAAIEASEDGTGQTDFFSFKCCKNGNIHITFTRPDLVDKINLMAGNRTRLGN